MNIRSSPDIDKKLEAERLLANPSGPDDIAQAHLIFGVLHEQANNWLAAIDSYTRCLAESPLDGHTLYFGNNNLAYSLIQMNRYDEAKPFCILAIEMDAERHNAHKNLGLVYQGQGQLLDAAFSFIRAYWLKRDNLRAFDHLDRLLSMSPGLAENSPVLTREFVSIKKQIAVDGWVRIH